MTKDVRADPHDQLSAPPRHVVAVQGREFGEVSSDPIKRDTDRDEIARTSSCTYPTGRQMHTTA